MVEKIAGSVLVVDVRTSQGVTAGPASEEGKSGAGLTGGGQQVEQVQILSLALEPDLVQTVLGRGRFQQETRRAAVDHTGDTVVTHQNHPE